VSADLIPRVWGVPFAPILLAGALLGGCATGPPASPVVARSRLGVVTAADLERFIAADPRWRGDGAEAADLSWRRARLEELIALNALAEEGRRDRLLECGPAAEEWRRQRLAILAEELERRAVDLAPGVDGSRVDAYLRDHPEELWRGERLRLRHIYRRLPARLGEAERTRARAEMEAMLAELRGGADFVQLARERSDSQSAGFDGLIAPVGRGDLEPAVEEVVWKLGVGDISDIVETGSGLHIFRLEERLPAASVPAEQARAGARVRLEREARQAAADRAFATLLESSGATYRPHLLGASGGDPAAAVLELGSERVTVGEVRAQWSALPFAAQRTTPLEQVVRSETWLRLAGWEAQRLGLEAEPAVAARLRSAEEQAWVSAASARWVREAGARVSDEELAEYVAAHRAELGRPAAWRLRAVIRRLVPDQAPLDTYEQLDRTAVAVRSGELDLAEAARRWSTDPSGDSGGDLGWVDARSLAEWAGGAFSAAVLGLAVGDLSDPLLVEVYEAERLRYRADAYAIVRVEQVRAEGTPPLEEMRTEALDRYLASRAPETRRELRRQILDSVGATVDEEALAGSVPGPAQPAN
jgi:parvulin-like peptidyl-prolyl isomerase